jgi:hypothetical protein
MRRRDFCRASLLGGAALSLPFARFADAATSPGDSIPAVRLSGEGTTLERAALDELGASLRGRVISPSHPDYESARRIWNADIDKRPAVIAHCAGAADVAKAVTFARERQLLLAVRGGGHSFPGLSSCDGGMVIDLSPMRAVRVDVAKRAVRAGAGAWGRDVDAETQHYGLATTMGQISDTGIAGLTLGGGFGWLARRFGLACDNLTAVDLVTADGELRHLSATENADLFWGVRGGGGNFGVATSLEYRVHPMSRKVLAAYVSYPIADARTVISGFGDFVASSPRELSADLSIERDDQGRVVSAIYACWSGELDAGRKALAPLQKLGKPLVDSVEVWDYLKVQKQFDEEEYPSRYRHYVRGGLISAFAPALIDYLRDGFRPTDQVAMYFQDSGGAVGDIEPTATAFWNRDSLYNLLILARWSDPSDGDRVRAVGRETWRKVEPFTAGFYSNLNESDKRSTARNYGGNYARLVQLKRKYDPTNLFRLNANVEPA